jgi:DNA-binding protein H-NS
MPLSGSLESLNPSDLLQMLMWGAQTGLLTCIGDDNRHHIFLHEGNVVGVTSSNYKDRLGAVLVRLGYVTECQFEEIFSLQVSSGRPLGEMFIDKKVLKPGDLEKALHIQARDIIYEFLTWTDGEFNFEERPLGQHEFKLKPIVVSTLLLEGAKRCDEINRFKQMIGDPDTIFRKAHSVSSSPDTMDRVHQSVITCLSTPRSFADILHMVNETEYNIISSMHSLLEQTIILKDEKATQEKKEQNARIQYLLELSETMEKKGWFHEALSNLESVLKIRSDCTEAKTIKDRIQAKVVKNAERIFTSSDCVPTVRHSVADVSIDKLYLNHREGFVFFRIDGNTNLKNLCYITGMHRKELYIILHKFIRMGLIYLDERKIGHSGKYNR